MQLRHSWSHFSVKRVVLNVKALIHYWKFEIPSFNIVRPYSAIIARSNDGLGHNGINKSVSR